MTRCIILDGWHRGHAIDMAKPLSVINLIRPRVVTIDSCCDGEMYDAPLAVHTYKLAFTSVDGKTALYTEDGSSEAFNKRVIWFREPNTKWAEEDLYVDIHDPKALIVRDDMGKIIEKIEVQS